LSTGQVQTFAGSGTGDCSTDNIDPAKVGDLSGYLTNDGTYLYILSTCVNGDTSLRRMSLATGATSTIIRMGCCGDGFASITVGPGNILYGANSVGVYKVDTINGSRTLIKALDLGQEWLAADTTALWGIVGTNVV